MGVVGFLFERYRIPLAPVVLGIVLGPIVESNFMRSVIKTDWDLSQFFTRPVSAVLIVLTVLMLAYPLISKGIRALTDRGADAGERMKEAEAASK